MADSVRPAPHRPGAVSLFFVVKAGVFALAFWVWLLVLVLTGDEAGGAHVLAAAGAVTTTLVGVVLGVRLALQRSAAARHAELKRLLVDISWNAFTAAGNAETPGTVVPFPTMPLNDERAPHREHGERVSLFERGAERPGRERGGAPSERRR
ncbi:hypothetical protein ACFY3U_21915 [Micromonospora sp. NPDC000089]|uniref:hypothetical protein n=1 Tax=unclassified Micromonospora TaxID=2617518 RepID=UPI0036B2BEB0